jgi:integrase
MTKLFERHDIDDSLYIYLQDNSARWYARFMLWGKWYCKSTKQKDKDKAIAMAHRIFLEHEIRVENGTLAQSKRFKDVAELAIERMYQELENGGGKSVFLDYIRALRNYHIPYFDRKFITSIDQEAVRAFDLWRNEKLKRVPAKSTLQTHNSAFQMVFKEAIERKWMLPVQVPILHSNGVMGQRRASFTKAEYDELYDAALFSEESGHTGKTRDIRTLMRYYMDFVVHSGIRPGTEVENITWGDISLRREKNNIVFFIHVRKGKTTKYTGTREIVCRDEIFDCLGELRNMHPNRKPKDKLFLLPDGSSTNQIGKTFTKLLERNGMKDSPHGPRTLYSLRHSYITWQLMRGNVSIDVLAKQCGTSIAMIEQHYSHVVPRMHTSALSGIEFGENPTKPAFKRSKKSLLSSVEYLKEWEYELKTRGCI